MWSDSESQGGADPAPTPSHFILTKEQWEQVRKRLNVAPRELAVLRLILRDLSEQAVADELDISDKTVHQHLKNAYRHMGVHSRTALAVRFSEVCAEVQASAKQGFTAAKKAAAAVRHTLFGACPEQGILQPAPSMA